MAAGEKRFIHNVEESRKSGPLATSEESFGQYVCELDWVSTYSSSHWVKIDPVEQPIQCNSVGQTILIAPACDDYLDHLSSKMNVMAGKFCVRSDMVDLFRTTFFRRKRSLCFVRPLVGLSQVLRNEFPRTVKSSTSMTESHRFGTGMPSILNPASCPQTCTTGHFGEKVLRSERRIRSLSNNFLQTWDVSTSFVF